jgi:CRP-like cAMP-binding protein/small-conductance mechanosensitive channel
MVLKHEKVFALPKWALILLIVLNLVVAGYAYTLGHIFAFVQADISDGFEFSVIDITAVVQILLIALTVDTAFRRTIINLNRINPEKRIPTIIVSAGSLIIYSLIGLGGFILLYDHELSGLLAASGGLGLGLGYVFRDRIADIVASVSLQTDGLVALGDYIVIFEGDERIPETYEVIQMEHRLITLKGTTYGLIKKFYNNKFLELDYINVTKQEPNRGFRRHLTISLGSHCDSEKVTEILNLAMECVISKNTFFRKWYLCGPTELEGGHVEYMVRYESDPSLEYPKDLTNRIVLNTIMRFLKAGAIDFTDIPSEAGAQLDLKNRLTAFASLGFLVVLNEEDLTHLAEHAHFVRTSVGEQLITKGQEAYSMYLLLEGRLEVKVPNAEGKSITVASIWPGDIVGEMSLLTGAPRSADVFSASSALMIEIEKDDIYPILERRPQLIQNISDVLAQRAAHNERVKSGADQDKSTSENSKNIAKKILKFFFNK